MTYVEQAADYVIEHGETAARELASALGWPTQRAASSLLVARKRGLIAHNGKRAAASRYRPVTVTVPVQPKPQPQPEGPVFTIEVHRDHVRVDHSVMAHILNGLGR